jgi:hypothetical protein
MSYYIKLHTVLHQIAYSTASNCIQYENPYCIKLHTVLHQIAYRACFYYIKLHTDYIKLFCNDAMMSYI